MEEDDVYYIHVDSKNRNKTLFPYGNNYVVSLPHTIKSVVRVDLISAKVPNSMYNLTVGTNVFSTNATLNSDMNTGFYSSQSLEDELNQRLRLGESIKYLPSEGKFVFLTNDSTNILTVHSSELARMLGFEVNTSYTMSALSIAICGYSYGVKSTKVVDFSLNEYVFLDIEEFRTPFFSDAGIAGNMFAVIPMDVPSTTIKTFKENTDYQMSQVLTQQQTISKLTIHWYDKNLQHLNFQGFENNGFVLRVYTRRIVGTSEPTKTKEEQERELVDKYIREIKTRLAEEERIKKEEETKKNKVRFGKWAVVLGILGILVFWYVSKKTSPVYYPR